MNFLMRSSHVQRVSAEQPSVPEPPADVHPTPKSATTLEGLIAEDSYPQYSTIDDHVGESEYRAKHYDVSDEEGWIAIPYKELPDNWNDAPDIHSLRSLDRSFVFPGEQVHILACLSACKQDTEIITPFKLAAAMRNGIKQSPKKQNGNAEEGNGALLRKGEMSPDSQGAEQMVKPCQKRRLIYKRMIAESSETLWSKKSAPKKSSVSLGMDGQESKENGTQKNAVNVSRLNAIIDKGNFDPKVSGGVARNNVKCCSLSNGDIVVLLQVNVGVDFLNDPVIEILQFEKSRERSLSSETQENLVDANQDPCGELLKWLLPLDNTLPPPARPLSPPLTSNQEWVAHLKSLVLNSLSHFRSYSMSSLPQNTTPPPAPIKAASSKPTFDLEDWDQYSSQQFWKSQKTGYEVLLSFRECSPAHAPHIVVYIDAITIVFEEASKGGQSLSLPIACIEAGNDHSLPNLALRRGEEHSFILKPATSLWKNFKAGGDRRTQSSQLQAGNQHQVCVRHPRLLN
ncbi:uncharacterized protein Pyn_14559 [Prunus yedoensis var. nudiflora]|uniref:Uncharacterized protein n=1 Tax=Prunus yedoensis var. nudiflora TaxID=2094558 RepID=A0A314YLJ9_PRUYE|nr:uncharacterized protein Pyn_14559 [Prunus yedoensis var. nudiflora]